jgi:hypothetical protein
MGGVVSAGVAPAAAAPGERARGRLTSAMASLAVLAAAAAVVSWDAQYTLVLSIRRIAAVAALEAGIPDVGALIFATLGIALALHGRRAIRPRGLNVACVGISLAMNTLAAAPRALNITRRYYRVGEERRRDAVDKVTAMQFDRHGNRIWRDVRALLDAEHARYAIGEVAVPYGRCAEPSNVAAGGGACPIRFRCAGCDHFRTDVSYLPDLTAYLDDLLRTRERLAAAIDGVDDWARASATPASEEITRIRRLVSRIKGDIARLPDTERAQVDQAVTVIRRHRAVSLGMPAVRAAASSPEGQAPA